MHKITVMELGECGTLWNASFDNSFKEEMRAKTGQEGGEERGEAIVSIPSRSF